MIRIKMACGGTLLSFCAVLKSICLHLNITILKLESQLLQHGVHFRNVSNTVHINKVKDP
jgi:hypothetical protein